MLRTMSNYGLINSGWECERRSDTSYHGIVNYITVVINPFAHQLIRIYILSYYVRINTIVILISSLDQAVNYHTLYSSLGISFFNLSESPSYKTIYINSVLVLMLLNLSPISSQWHGILVSRYFYSLVPNFTLMQARIPRFLCTAFFYTSYGLVPRSGSRVVLPTDAFQAPSFTVVERQWANDLSLYGLLRLAKSIKILFPASCLPDVLPSQSLEILFKLCLPLSHSFKVPTCVSPSSSRSFAYFRFNIVGVCSTSRSFSIHELIAYIN